MSDFYGRATGVLKNDFLRLEYLTDAGPRIVRLIPAWSNQNILAELPGLTLDSPNGKYTLFGGHRLWHSPEDPVRTYIDDSQGLQVEKIPGGVRLTQPTEALTGIQKQMEVTLPGNRPLVKIVHRLHNCGASPVTLAPWGLTNFPNQGAVIFPFRSADSGPASLLPDRQLVLWPYTRLDDPRLEMHADAIVLRTNEDTHPIKLGLRVLPGWSGYWDGTTLLIKRFGYHPDCTYPDLGCNAETYTNAQFIELESLGALAPIQPGQSAQHTEEWELYEGLDEEAIPELRWL